MSDRNQTGQLARQWTAKLVWTRAKQLARDAWRWAGLLDHKFVEIIRGDVPGDILPAIGRERERRMHLVLGCARVLAAVLVAVRFHLATDPTDHLKFHGSVIGTIETGFFVYALVMLRARRSLSKQWVRVASIALDIGFTCLFTWSTGNPESDFYLFLIIPIATAAEIARPVPVLITGLAAVVAGLGVLFLTAAFAHPHEPASWLPILVRKGVPRALLLMFLVAVVRAQRQRSAAVLGYLIGVVAALRDLHDYYLEIHQGVDASVVCVRAAGFVRRHLGEHVGAIGVHNTKTRELHAAYVDRGGASALYAGPVHLLPAPLASPVSNCLRERTDQRVPGIPSLGVPEERVVHLLFAGRTDSLQLIVAFDGLPESPRRGYYAWLITLFEFALAAGLAGQEVAFTTQELASDHEECAQLLSLWKSRLVLIQDAADCDSLLLLALLSLDPAGREGGFLVLPEEAGAMVASSATAPPRTGAEAGAALLLERRLKEFPRPADNLLLIDATALLQRCSRHAPACPCLSAVAGDLTEPGRCAVAGCSAACNNYVIEPLRVGQNTVGAMVWTNCNTTLPERLKFVTRELVGSWWYTRGRLAAQALDRLDSQREAVLTLVNARAHDQQDHIRDLYDVRQELDGIRRDAVNTLACAADSDAGEFIRQLSGGVEHLDEVLRSMQEGRSQLDAVNQVPKPGELRVGVDRFDLAATAELVVENLQSRQWGVRPNVTFVAPERPVRVRGQRQAVALVIRELIRNAQKNSPLDSPIEVRVLADASDLLGLPPRMTLRAPTMAAVSVTDRGKGFDGERIDELMGAGTSLTGGSGSGWLIARLVAEANRGFFWPRSRRGIEGDKGSVCAVLLRKVEVNDHV
jgi:signal transduction histidine kinase